MCIRDSYEDFGRNHFNWKKSLYPISIKDIQKFESSNSLIAINVHVLEGDEREISPCYVSKQNTKDNTHIINLLFSYNVQSRSHFHLITDLSMIFGLKNIRDTNSRHKIHVCPRCYYRAYSEEAMKNHLKRCKLNNPMKVVLSEEPHRFTDIQNTTKSRLIIVYDFESKNESIQCKICQNLTCSCRKFTKHTIEQSPICYSLYIIDIIDKKIISQETYTCLLYTSPSPRDKRQSRMPSSA